MGGKDVPSGTKITVRIGRFPGTVTVELTLPGQRQPAILEDLAIKDGVLTLPVPLVFLCHAKEDKNVVADLSNRLWENGIITWFDEKDLLPGDDWKAKIEETIDQADRIVIFLSPRSVGKTGYIQREIRYAFEQQDLRPRGKCYIVPVLIEACEPPREFRDIHWLHLWEAGWFDRLVRALRE